MNVTTNILKDSTNEVTIDGCPYSVDSNSRIQSPVWLASENYEGDQCHPGKYGRVAEGDEVEESHPVAKVAGLKIYDNQRGPIVIAETKESWLEKVNQCCSTTEAEED